MSEKRDNSFSFEYQDKAGWDKIACAAPYTYRRISINVSGQRFFNNYSIEIKSEYLFL